MRRLTAIFTALALAASAGAQNNRPSRTIEAFIDQALPASTAPGLAYAILEGGEIRTGARGERLQGSDQPVTEDTLFPLGSISKSITALAVLQLVEAGQVGLDSDISTYLGAFDGSSGGGVTPRQLLSHTSGYSTLQGNEIRAEPSGREEALADRVEALADAGPAVEPGQRWQYSNANYVILGGLIESVSGQSFADYVENEIFLPAGMTDSFVGSGALPETVATGHAPWFFSRRPVANSDASAATAPAGGVVASATDVARFLAIMSNGEDDLISAAGKAMMLQPAGPASPHYGLGWFIDAESGLAFHTGLTPGVETIAVLSLSESTGSEARGAVVLVNANSGMGFGLTGDLLSGISALALGQTYEARGGAPGAQFFFLMLIATPFILFAGIAGVWFRRAGLRAKSGVSGLFSLWFPLLAFLAMGWAFLFLVPSLFSVSLATLHLYQPDMVILLVAGSAAGLALALFRLGLVYLFKPGPAPS